MYQLETFFRLTFLFLTAVLAIGMLLVMRPLPSVEPEVNEQLPPKLGTVAIAWPGYGQSAVGAIGYGVLDYHGQQKSAPMASIAKLVTAMTVMSEKPLKVGEQGPLVTLNETDISYYPYYLSRGGSAVPVAIGQQISQYDLLQAMLIPSGNNIADSLAVWAFGSMDNYVLKANAYLKSIGLSNTTVSDASGFSDKSVSTASDLVKLGILALQNPVIAKIVNTKQAVIPVSGTIINTNRLLGQSGIVGIKTGNTAEAGGCYLYAAKHEVAGREIVIVGAVLGGPSLFQAMVNSQQTLESTKVVFTEVVVIKKGQVLASYRAPWGATAKVGAADNLKLITWKSQQPKINTQIVKVKGFITKGSTVGSVEATVDGQKAKTNVVLLDNLESPSPRWRIFH
jgi:D-alanyl-D-alanine carboxypeptidase (penicillin-binding protein 5/6)